MLIKNPNMNNTPDEIFNHNCHFVKILQSLPLVSVGANNFFISSDPRTPEVKAQREAMKINKD